MTTSVTRAAEGFDRRAFTVQEILRMQEAGIISEDENFELIEGEIVPKPAKTHVHELIKSALTLGLARALPDNLWLGVESTMYLSKLTFVEPDLVVYPRGIKLEEVKGSDILLAIEVALTSLKYDRGLKAQIYSRYGVRELWAIDANRRRAPYSQWAPLRRLGKHRRTRPGGYLELRCDPRFLSEARSDIADGRHARRGARTPAPRRPPFPIANSGELHRCPVHPTTTPDLRSAGCGSAN